MKSLRRRSRQPGRRGLLGRGQKGVFSFFFEDFGGEGLSGLVGLLEGDHGVEEDREVPKGYLDLFGAGVEGEGVGQEALFAEGEFANKGLLVYGEFADGLELVILYRVSDGGFGFLYFSAYGDADPVKVEGRGNEVVVGEEGLEGKLGGVRGPAVFQFGLERAFSDFKKIIPGAFPAAFLYVKLQVGIHRGDPGGEVVFTYPDPAVATDFGSQGPVKGR